MTEATPPRANRDGHPCPPWCVTDHGRYGFHGSERIAVAMPGAGGFRVSAVLPGGADVPVVCVAELGTTEPLWTGIGEAVNLAVVVERLAAATPEEHMELAAAIRRAAAQVTEARDG